MIRALHIGLLSLLYAAAVVYFLARPAQSQQMNCDAYDVLAERLADQYGERPIERGLDWRGEMVEWWGNFETGTWTLLVISASGMACIPAHGEMFETLEAAALGIDG